MTPDLRWRTGLLAALLTAAIGGACALFTLQQLRDSGARAAIDDSRAMAESVAQTLAQQLGRALRLGIPLAQLPGVPAYLQSALERQPVLRSIAVLQPDGSVLYAAQARSVGDANGAGAGADDGGRVAVPIPAPAAPAASSAADAAGGKVAVAILGSATAAPASLLRAAWLAAAAVLALALAAGLAAAFGPGARLERQRRELLARLHPGLHPDSHSGAQPMPHTGLASEDGLRPALQALAQGDADAQAAREAVQAYAQELLAIDFDGQMRAGIERIVRDC